MLPGHEAERSASSPARASRAGGTSAPDVLRFVVSHGIAARDPLEIPIARWPSVLEALTQRNLTGLAVAAVQAGTLAMTDDQSEALFDRHRSAMIHALELERILLSFGARLEAAGIRYVVLKGPALAHTMYPDPSWRPFSDLDLLVRGDDWVRSQELLVDAGFRRRLPEPRRGFDVRFGKAATHANADGLEIDLHRTLVLGPAGLWIDPVEIGSFVASFELGGRRFDRLDDTGLLLHACIHATLGWSPPLPIPLRDVSQLLASGRIDWDRFDDWAARWRLRAVVRSSFASATEAIGAVAPPRASAYGGIEPTASEAWVLRTYTVERRRPAALSIGTLRAIHGVRAKAAYATGLFLPSRAFVRARGARYLRRWKVPFAWLRRTR